MYQTSQAMITTVKDATNQVRSIVKRESSMTNVDAIASFGVISQSEAIGDMHQQIGEA